MAISAIDAVWIAAAALATKATSRKTSKFDLQDVCFEASTILDLARQITEENIDISTVLSSATAHAKGSEANYLIDEHGLRRVSYMGEFSGVKECPAINVINEGRNYQVIQKFADTTKTFEFMNREYTEQLKRGFRTNRGRTVATEWFILVDPTAYDVVGAFGKLDKIDWKQSTNVAVGDIIYIYVSNDFQSLKFKCKVNRVNLPKPDIDDKKFNISGRFDGTYGRYMEIELLKELKGSLYNKAALEKYGFSSPNGSVRVIPQVKEGLDLVQKLQESQELDPEIHDGSYELVKETINAYAHMGDLSSIDYKDLNLVYLMSIGTWKHKVQAKKKTIADSNLPQKEKDKLLAILNNVWSKAENYEYHNEEKGRPSIGMFGTGFFTFLGKTDDSSPRSFIQMCIDIKDMTDEQTILNRCSETLTDKFHGMKAASASMVLHCLKPTVFPIFNSNMGADNIFVYLGVEIKWKTEIYSYIKNTRIVKDFRDKNFKVKNYRIFDMAAWDIGQSIKHTEIDYLGVLDYLENNREVQYSDPETAGLSSKEKNRLLDVKAKGQTAVAEMKKMVELCKENYGLDKCESMTWLDGSNTKTRKYLWAQIKYSQYADFPVSISLFAEMSPETDKARYRFSLEIKNDKADKAQMEKYHSHLDVPMKAESSLVYVSGSNEFDTFLVLDESPDDIKHKIADGTYKKVQLCRIEELKDSTTNDDIESAMLEGVQDLIPYYEHVLGIKKFEYWPTLEEYDPGISKEKWLEILNNSTITFNENLRMFKAMLELEGESTCANLAEQFGGTAASYNGLGRAFGERVHKETNCDLCKDEDRERFYTISFVGREVVENGKNRYSWKLREELRDALEDMDLSEIELNSKNTDNREFDKNMILYGPPGTGKTYNTAIYAVAICDGKSIDELTDYDAVMARYNELKTQRRIAFTTFHQSYGYEEFIEGIKPIVDKESENVGYTIEAGVFKKFCTDAGKKNVTVSDAEVRKDAKVWNILLDGTGVSELKKRCFEENTIRIGWDESPEYISEDIADLSDKSKKILINFQDEMKIGDIVVIQRSKTSIDAIAIVTGEYEYDKNDNPWPRKRTVNWLIKGEEIDIFYLNGGVQLDRKSVYPLDRIQPEKILSLVKKKEQITIENENRPFVFIIDEINRGNISKIFGELITLIENTKREGMLEAASAILPYSGEEFSVPNNVYILATMNTADRSIALMDTALRRRFKFEEMMPKSQILRDIGADIINAEGIKLDVAAMLDTINERIEFLFDREHTIGHAFFTGLKNEPTVAKLASIFKKSVIPLLQEYFYEDYSKIMLVLGDNGKEKDDQKFILATETKANLIFRGDTSDIDIPDYSYEIQDKAFYNIMSYIEITG